MTAPRWRSASDSGSITLMLAVLFVALIALAGIVIDGGAKLNQAENATAIAQEAARAGAGMVNQGQALSTGSFTVDQAQAIAAAQQYLASADAYMKGIERRIAAGRTSVAQGSVAAAARDAARQASISLTPAAAQTAALSSAQAALGQDGLNCNPVVRVSVSGFGVPVGVPASVRATVICRVSLSNLLVPGMPGSRTLTATFTSPLDPFRGR